MPILWKYLLRNYLKVFTLCSVSFIGILLVTRFQEIARFASSCPNLYPVFLFILYLVPFILPIAVPISCLISSLILIQRLSQTSELTSFRASGISIKDLLTPILFASLLITLFNFYITAEVTPQSRVLSKKLIYEMSSNNPLFLLQKKNLFKFQNAYADMSSFQSGRTADDVIIVSKGKSQSRLNLMIAKKFELKDEVLTGSQVSFISSASSGMDDSYDHLVIENQKVMKARASSFSKFIASSDWNESDSHLPLRLALAKNRLQESQEISKIHVEIVRRMSLSLAVFTFTLMGCAFGMQIGRHASKKGLLKVVILTASFMILFMLAKSIKNAPLISITVYTLIHVVVIFFSLQALRRVSQGIE